MVSHRLLSQGAQGVGDSKSFGGNGATRAGQMGLAHSWHTGPAIFPAKSQFSTNWQSLYQVIRSIVEAYLRLLPHAQGDKRADVTNTAGHI